MVVGGEYCGDIVTGGESTPFLIAGRGRPVTEVHTRYTTIRGAERRSPTVEAILRGVPIARPRHMPDRLVSQPEEVAGQLAAGLFLIDVQYGLTRYTGDPAGAGHYGQAGKLGGVDVNQMSRHLYHQALHAPLLQRVDPIGDTACREVWHRREHHGVSQPTCLMLEGEDPSGRSNQRRSQSQHTDRVTALPSQCLSGDIRTIAEILDRTIHTLPDIGTDMRCTVHNPRHRLLRHP